MQAITFIIALKSLWMQNQTKSYFMLIDKIKSK